MLKIIYHCAIRNLLRTRLRSFFTLLIISVIFALFLVVTSIGRELSTEITNTLDEKNIDIVVQSKFASSPFSSAISSATVRGIASMDGVDTMTSLLIGKKWLDLDTSLLLLGFSDFKPIAKRLGIALIEGRPFNPTAREISIGQKAARVLKLGVGDQLELDSDEPYTITGVYSIGLDFLDACAYMDIGNAQRLLKRPDQAGMLFLSMRDSSDIGETIARINATYPKVVAFPSGELLKHLGSRKTTIRFIRLISVIAFVIASVVLLNTLIITINERTKEIGILLAIGWSQRMIITIFGVESLLLAYAGAIAGLLLTYPAFLLLRLSPNIGLNFLPKFPSPEMFGLLVAACTLMGILSAVFPAIYSTRMLPAKALRCE